LTRIEDLLKNAVELELENFSIESEEMELEILQQEITKAVEAKKFRIIEKPAQPTVSKPMFALPKEQYHGRVCEVKLGGGSRKAVKIGGETVPPLYFFEARPENKPVISHDVFDMPLKLPSSVRKFYEDVMESPAEWAKKQVKEFNAEAITLHLISTDPNWKNTSAKDAAKTVEDVLQAVKVPIIISGSGNPDKDPEVLEEAARVASGERCLLSSVSPIMDYKRVVKAAVEHNHAVLTLVSMDPAGMKQLNRNVMKEGLKPESIVMDPVTGSLGYGVEYSITTMERIRLTALKGDVDLAMPILSGASNAWSAREAWISEAQWGEREYRGPLWETITATMMLLSGADLFMMLHPAAIKTLKSFINAVFGESKDKTSEYEKWLFIK